MNVLFLSLLDFDTIDERNIYTDLLREFWKHGHNLYVVSPIERKKGINTFVLHTDKAVILKPRILNMQKTGYLEKTLSLVTIENILVNAIKMHFPDIKFDLVLYATPPVTFQKVVSYVKNRDHAITYLLQKDIFPEGAADLGALSKTGWKGLFYKYFRNKEINLLKVSDYIGCMSPANVEYIIRHNPEINPDCVEICPNSIEVVDKSVNAETRLRIRKKYGIPLDKKVFVYGGNLGKPQGIPFLIKCLKSAKGIDEAFFLIVGDGTEYGLLEDYTKKMQQQNLKLMKRMPKEDYDTLVGACDVGMIFLDHRFTIPNFPSRLLSYMQAKLPVLAVTDLNTDIGKIITEGRFGWWCESNDEASFIKVIQEVISNKSTINYSVNSWKYLCEHYSANHSYSVIYNALQKGCG